MNNIKYAGKKFIFNRLGNNAIDELVSVSCNLERLKMMVKYCSNDEMNDHDMCIQFDEMILSIESFLHYLGDLIANNFNQSSYMDRRQDENIR